MKKIVFLAFNMLLFTGILKAQIPANAMQDSSRHHQFNQSRNHEFGNRDMAHEQMNHHFGDRHHHSMIHYTPEQIAQLKTIKEDYAQKKQSLFDNNKLSLGDYKRQLLALEKDKKGKTKALLTPQQQQQIADAKKRHSDDEQVRQAAMLERMKLTAGLADDQVQKIKDLQTNLHTKIKAIHDDDNLLPEQKKEQVKTLIQNQKNAYSSILTPDQQDKLKAMREHRDRDSR
jgi:predicted transglutaminase-like cysteine proteinase